MASDTALRDQATAARHWLFDRAIPLWIEHGVDTRQGGFHDALDPTSLRNAAAFKRLRVTARQIYVFAQGALHGVPGARAAVDHGLDFLFGRMRHPDGGFVARCDPDGAIIDETRDLYDLAFVLFALAHAHRLTGDAAIRDEASALLGFIRARLRHPQGGYAEALPDRSPRRQNPHMHLFEAALACSEYMPHSDYDALCGELAELAAGHFIDAAGGHVFEYYGADLVPERADGRAVVEPGHQLEWIWLLAEFERLHGRRIAGADVLAASVHRHGLDTATGLLRGSILDDGTITDASVRIWPHCEWLKAALVSDTGLSPLQAYAALSRFLATPVAGLWFERWDPGSASFPPSDVPASSLYHITTAITALDEHARER